VTRLLDLGVPSYLLQSTVLGVMAQRLIRTLCPHCKEKQELDISAWEHLTAPWKAPPPKGTTYLPKGCLECRMTGYLGRMGIYETMLMTPELRKILTPETDLAALQDRAYKDGMKPLRISGAMKIASGATSVDEIMNVAPPPQGDRRQQAR
jgi:general secretion pathway protein E